MSKKIYILAALFISFSAHAEDCANSLQIFKNTKLDPEKRSQAGQCLVAKHLENSEVAQVILRAIKNSNEDLLLREDLIEAFSKTNLRKKIKVEGNLGAEVSDQDKNAIGSLNSGNAGDLLALASSVKSMNEILPVTRLEGEFFKAFSEIALEETNHVLLRASAVEAMERASKTVMDSGIYDEKVARLVNETIRTIAQRDDVNSYYSGATLAYQNMNLDVRKLSSQGAPVPAAR